MQSTLPATTTEGTARARGDDNTATKAAASGEVTKASRRMSNATVAAARLAGVRPFAHIVARIHAVAIDPRKTVADLADIVERDIAFASRMLRLVNSPGMGLSQRCSSVRFATSLLGIKRVAHLATVTAAYAFVEDSSSVAPRVAEHAFAVGGISRALASYVGLSADEAFTAGLLHDVGILLMLQAGEARYEEMIAASSPGEPKIEDEAELFGFDHTELGCAVLQGWNLPEPIPTIVRMHHDLEGAATQEGSIGKYVALVALADMLARLLPTAPELNETVTTALTEHPALAQLGMSIPQVAELWGALREAIGAGVRTVPPPLPTLMPPKVQAGSAEHTDPNMSLADVLEPAANRVNQKSNHASYIIAAVVFVIALGITGAVATDWFGSTASSQSNH